MGMFTLASEVWARGRREVEAELRRTTMHASRCEPDAGACERLQREPHSKNRGSPHGKENSRFRRPGGGEPLRELPEEAQTEHKRESDSVQLEKDMQRSPSTTICFDGEVASTPSRGKAPSSSSTREGQKMSVSWKTVRWVASFRCAGLRPSDGPGALKSGPGTVLRGRETEKWGAPPLTVHMHCKEFRNRAASSLPSVRYTAAEELTGVHRPPEHFASWT
ncbi:hypothetical protein FB451DRAFT_1183035 [Mycena latifolia]|nr:hypothetical protein FB451DRAFT_1183035 [Mycena latifolia]